MVHPHAAILKAYIDGKTIMAVQSDGTYTDLTEQEVLIHLGQKGTTIGLCIKPEVVDVGGVSLIRPLRVEPEMGQRFFYLSPEEVSGVQCDFWYATTRDVYLLTAGVCWLMRADAVAAAAAISKLLKGG